MKIIKEVPLSEPITKTLASCPRGKFLIITPEVLEFISKALRHSIFNSGFNFENAANCVDLIRDIEEILEDKSCKQA